MSWNIPAFVAVSVVVTRPRVQVGVLPFTDILVLSSDNDPLLYSGKQCHCRYILPNDLGNGFFSNHELNSDIYSDLKITSIVDAVEGRINVTYSNDLVGCSCTLSLCVLMFIAQKSFLFFGK
ncbi:Anaphase-promoting complex subunit 1 [Zea mays]|uniref:Anaphase-promoting complex subunit 1 n=1 Tax=Zea mays TaxID=4577 RepID=A0A1D6M694_MAIZE|nr:Anaphase-promoting complex subunit 1 [Zea mays]